MATPQLRFKEFDGDWDKTTLGKVVEFSNGKRIPLSESDRQKRQGSYRYYGASGVIDYIDDYIFDGQYILIGEDGANILTRSSPLAFTVEGKFWVNNHAHIFQSKDGDNFFLATYLETLNYERFNSGTAQPKLNLENLKKVPVANPSKEEQTKIASFLSVVDEKISQLNQKHELLSQYKQGMMQKLFSQQIRFKADDGSEFGEWENLKFRDVITIKYGKDHKALKEGNIPVLGTGGIMRYVDSYLYDGESILIGRKGTIDKPQFISGKFWTVDTLFYTEIGERLIPKFAYQQLLLVNWLNLNEATGVPSLNTTSIGNIEVKIPCLEEQTKIANFLSAIDQKIEVVAQQIEQAKQWKKGLLQQMFV